MSLRIIFPGALAAALVSLCPAQEPALEVGELPRRPALEPDEALKSFAIAPGYRLEIAAAEPEVVDPIAVCFDENNALFVLEMIDYSERRAEKLSRVRRLTDDNGDGRYERSTVYLDGLAWATGLTCWKGGVFVAASPDIHYARDTDGDGVADERRVVLSGFGEGRALNVQALVNSLTFGPDNRIWGAAAANGGVVKGVNLNGADFSFDPEKLDIRAETGTAQYGLTFDAQGRRFVCSNSHHLQWIPLEQPYAMGRLARTGARLVDIPVDDPAAEVFRRSPEEPWRVVRTNWRASGAISGIVEGGGRSSGYFTSASGLCVYTGDLLPELTGQIFVGDVGSNLVHRKVLRETPDGPVAERAPEEAKSEFVASTDNWFRPVACANGPDGALYIVDMYREVVEHPSSLPAAIKQKLDLNSGNDRGRIYRVVPDSARAARRALALGSLSAPALAAMTGHPNGWHRVTARRLLVERQEKTAAPALRRIGGVDALAALEGLGALTAEDVRRGLTSRDDGVACQALRLLEKHPAFAGALAQDLPALSAHRSAAVRRQWALTLGRIPFSGRVEQLAALWKKEPCPPRLQEAIRLSANTGAEALALLQSLPALDTELAAMIGRSQDAEAIGRAAGWLGEVAGERPAVLFGHLAALNSPLALEKFREAALACLHDPQASADGQAAAAALLAQDTLPATREALARVFRDAATPEKTRLSLLPALDETMAASTWDAWAEASSALRAAVLERAIARPAWHRSLLDAIAAKKLRAQELTSAQIQQLRQAGGETQQAHALAVLGPPPASRQDAVTAKLPALKMEGDAERGETLFRQRCLTCHRHGEEGAAIGPDRASFRNLGKPTLLLHLIDPNREVAPQYLAATAATRQGETWQGLLLKDDADGVALRLVSGREMAISRPDIVSFERLAQSLMPEGLETGLSHNDLADLLEFLVK